MTGRRPVVAFFDYPDVFEDFYEHYGVTYESFATSWAATAWHDLATLVQRDLADVVWYELALSMPPHAVSQHAAGFRVRVLRSSWFHRRLWSLFYLSPRAWRWQGSERAYRGFATVASYVALLTRRLLLALRADRPDLVLVQDWATGRFDVLAVGAAVMGIPLVAVHTGSTSDKYLAPWVRRATLRLANVFVVSGERERRNLVDRMGIAPDRVRVVLTPIAIDRFRPMERTASCHAAGLDPGRRHLLFVGRLDPVKQLDRIIRAFAAVADRHRDVDLVVVGEGTEGGRLRQLSDEMVPGRVRWLGWVDGKDALAHVYNAAELLVLYSVREGFPTVVGEAMACGTPVLTGRVGGVEELVVDGTTGWLVGDGADDLQQRLDDLLADRDALGRARSAAREIAVRRVAPAVVTDELRSALMLALSRRGRRAADRVVPGG